MLATDILVLWDHVYWIRDAILSAADDPAVDLDAATAAGRTIRGTLVHELDVEWSWRVRLQGADRTAFSEEDEDLVAADFPTVGRIRARWLQEEDAMRTWLASLTDDDLAQGCRAERRAPGHPFWFHLQHLYSHAIQQFADAAAALSAAGRSPGELDFLEFVEEREKSGRSTGGPAVGG